MNTDHAQSPDRLIWLSLLAAMAVALIADQARANLHSTARAAATPAAVFDDPMTAEAWCRMHRDALSGDEAIGFYEGLFETSALPGTLPLPVHVPSGRPSHHVHAIR